MIVRSDNRLVAGVAGGVAEHLQVPVKTVRLGFAALSLVAGAGLLLYAWLWVFTPGSAEVAADAERSWSTRQRSLAEEMSRVQQGLFGGRDLRSLNAPWREMLLGAALLVLAVLALGQWAGWNVQWNLVWAAVGIVAGTLVAWLQMERGSARTGKKARGMALARLLIGLVLVIGGLLAVVGGLVETSAVLTGLWVALAVLGGAGVVLLPWATRLWRDYLAERSSRQAAAQRADFAAHLHDSVLQTLAVIQKRSEEPAAVRTLARVQERELREWLYGSQESEGGEVTLQIKQEAQNVEQLLLKDVEVVAVGTARGFAGQGALVAASREAMMNAAKHSEGHISVFIECREQLVEVFVRDRGAGFDVEAIAADRHGIRESIFARMQRAGGTAKIRSNANGTEVELGMPRSTEQEQES